MHTPSTAVIAYSFGGSPRYGAGTANEALARIVISTAQKTGSIIIAQDYLEKPLRGMEAPLANSLFILEHRKKGCFLGTEEVTLQAALYLRTLDIRHVFLVAHPFLHRFKCKKLLRRSGFSVGCVKTGYVPFDPRNEHWWVRSPFHLLLYAILQILFKRHGV